MTDLFEGGDQSALEREEILSKWKDKSKEEILEAKINADLYVKTITKRQDEISKDYLEAKKQLDAQTSLQELVDKLNAGTSNSDTTKAKEENLPQFKPEDIDKRVKELIEETRRVEKQTINAQTVQAKLKDRFGDSYKDVLRNTGLSEKQINDIAASSPEAIFKLVGMDDVRKETFQTPPRSDQRNDNFSPKGQTKRTYAFYQEMKKTNPKAYLDPKIAVQMHNDVMEMGEAVFYG